MTYLNISSTVKFSIIFLIICSSLQSCSASYLEKNIINKVDTLEIRDTLIQWKKDSTACLKLRNNVMADFLINNLNLIGKTEEEIIALLGNPNKRYNKHIYLNIIKVDGEFIILNYYFDAVCINGKPKENSDGLCWLQIFIYPKTKKVVEVNKDCS